MPTYTGSANLYRAFKQKMGEGDFDLSADTFKILICDSGYTPDANAHDFVDDVSGDEITGNGYSRQTVAATWSASGSSMVFDVADASWTASGGDIVGRYWVLFKDAGGADSANPLVAYGYLDATPADATISDGDIGQIQIASGGVFSI